jgi:hypothetical protein
MMDTRQTTAPTAKNRTGETKIESSVYPTKTREMHNHHFDSTIWNDLEFRDVDIVISTYAKSGTTWTQQIVAQLLFGSDPDLEVAEMSPWLDLRVPPKEIKLPMVEAQTHRRFPKTHSPWTPWSSPRRRSTSPSDATGVTWSGACITTTPTRTSSGTTCSTTRRDAWDRPSSLPPRTSGSTSATGWTATATPSGRSGRTCAPGGSSATSRTSCSCTSPT